jgi:putative transposase
MFHTSGVRRAWASANIESSFASRAADGVIHHSDQGSQYTSIAFGERCEKMGVRPSMGTVGDAYDNAMAESFFATLECELIDRRSWQTKTEARLALFTYIEGWYNPRRRHSPLGQTSPANFERKHIDETRSQPHRGEHGIPTVGACVAGANAAGGYPCTGAHPPNLKSSPNLSTQWGQVQ